jgi:hypothetical protein
MNMPPSFEQPPSPTFHGKSSSSGSLRLHCAAQSPFHFSTIKGSSFESTTPDRPDPESEASDQLLDISAKKPNFMLKLTHKFVRSISIHQGIEDPQSWYSGRRVLLSCLNNLICASTSLLLALCLFGLILGSSFNRYPTNQQCKVLYAFEYRIQATLF